MDELFETVRGAPALIDRYMSNASASEREAAMANIREFAAVIFRIASRLSHEEHEAEIRANLKQAVE